MSESDTVLDDVYVQAQHADMVATLKKPGDAVLQSLTPYGCDLLHMVVGIAGEAGELLDAIKKCVIYNKPLDMENVVEELGDIEFYMEGFRQILNISREHTLEENVQKLSVRYNGLKYSDEAAQLRADKAS